jgi:hypothetical protein
MIWLQVLLAVLFFLLLMRYRVYLTSKADVAAMAEHLEDELKQLH